MYKLACTVYKFRFVSPTKHEVQKHLDTLEALDSDVPTDDAASQTLLRQPDLLLTLLRFRYCKSCAASTFVTGSCASFD